MSKKYSLDYVEVSENKRWLPGDYDFYIFNYHWKQMGWLDSSKIRNLLHNVFTIVLEVSPNDPFVFVKEENFDGFLVLDPTCWSVKSNVATLPRPLVDHREIKKYSSEETPIIGTFGLSIEDKGFVELVQAVEKEFSSATIKINVPTLLNYSDDVRLAFESELKAANKKPQIKILLTHYNFTREDLVNWCAQNSLNAFFYTRKLGNGLSATTDQAIASGVPVAISTNPTFRHLMDHIQPYPIASLKSSMEDGHKKIAQIREEWHSNQFLKKSDELILRLSAIEKEKNALTRVILPRVRNRDLLWLIKRVRISDFLPPLFSKVFRFLFKKNHTRKANISTDTVAQYSHILLNSYSHAHEDLILDLLLEKKEKGFYIDIGANSPVFGNNTLRFYKRGWSGINVEPNPICHAALMEVRPRDINLRVAVSDFDGFSEMNFSGVDTSVTSLNSILAGDTAGGLNRSSNMETVETRRLASILDENNVSGKIDFMSVDAEGSDLEVLKGNDWENYRPCLVMVEANKGASHLIKFMESKDYFYILSNSVNAIFLDKHSSLANSLIPENINAP